MNCLRYKYAFYIILIVSSQLYICTEAFVSATVGSAPLFPHKKISMCNTPRLYSVNSNLDTPQSISSMMKDASASVSNVCNDLININNICLVDVPIPAVGSTELDEWPGKSVVYCTKRYTYLLYITYIVYTHVGGIRQKYSILLPMISEMMLNLNFTREEIKQSNFVGIVEDAVGIWENDKYVVICFPTVDSIDRIIQYSSIYGNDNNRKMIVLVNQNFFLDPMSSEESIDFLASATIAYRLEKLNMRGPNGLSIRGLLYKQYPDDYIIARRLDNGIYNILSISKTLPVINDLNKIFYDDSVVRDRGLSLLDRLKKSIPNF